MSTQAEIQVSYDVSNDFFRLWLDRGMSYTCAVYEPGDSLEEAQVRKLDWMARAARVGPEKSLLDLGCGWGACLDFMARTKGVRDLTGVTLSPAQWKEIGRRSIPGATAHCLSYREFVPGRTFDSVVSIGMMEHVATPEEARNGKQLELFRELFRKAWEWTNPGAGFGLQSIIRTRTPRNRAHLRELNWLTYEIFPGGMSPRLEDIVATSGPHWEILEVQTRRPHYARTCGDWLSRLVENEREIRRRWGGAIFDDYKRYLEACIMAFELNYQSLAQLALLRVDQ